MPFALQPALRMHASYLYAMYVHMSFYTWGGGHGIYYQQILCVYRNSKARELYEGGKKPVVLAICCKPYGYGARITVERNAIRAR